MSDNVSSHEDYLALLVQIDGLKQEVMNLNAARAADKYLEI